NAPQHIVNPCCEALKRSGPLNIPLGDSGKTEVATSVTRLSRSPRQLEARNERLACVRETASPFHERGHPPPRHETDPPDANVGLWAQRKAIGRPNDCAAFGALDPCKLAE